MLDRIRNTSFVRVCVVVRAGELPPFLRGTLCHRLSLHRRMPPGWMCLLRPKWFGPNALHPPTRVQVPLCSVREGIGEGCSTGATEIDTREQPNHVPGWMYSVCVACARIRDVLGSRPCRRRAVLDRNCNHNILGPTNTPRYWQWSRMFQASGRPSFRCSSSSSGVW